MKLHPLTIIGIGVTIAVVALSIAFFRFFQPRMTEAGYYKEYQAALKSEADKMQLAIKRREKAIEDVEKMQLEWQNVVARKTPLPDVQAGGINLAANRWQLTVDALKWRNNVQRAVNAQLKRGGVQVLAGPSVPFPSTSAAQVVESYFNYPAVKFPVAIFELGQVTIAGTFSQIEQHLRAWSNMPNYMAVTDGLAISGTSPRLVATYNLVVIAFIRGDKVSPPVPEGAAPSQAGLPQGFLEAGGGEGGGGGGGLVGGGNAGGGGGSAMQAN